MNNREREKNPYKNQIKQIKQPWEKKPVGANPWLKYEPQIQVVYPNGIEEKNISEEDIILLAPLWKKLAAAQEQRPVVKDKTFISEEVAAKFERLSEKWEQETFFLASLSKAAMHPAYQSIIGLGEPVLPILFRDMQKAPKYWFWALRAITQQDPTKSEDAGNIRKMTASWLEWAKANGYIK